MAKKYTKDHEWVEVIDGDLVKMGITHYAQEQLGDIVFIDLPDVGANFAQGDEIAVLESVKAASEIYMPVAGTVVAVNDALVGNSALLNSDAEGEGWIADLKLADRSALDGLLDEMSYQASIQ